MKRTLYFIGGVSQVGKSTVAGMIAERKGMEIYHTDQLRNEALAKAENLTVDAFAWLQALKIIEARDAEGSSDVLFEGIAITPDLIHGLHLKNLDVKAAFVGYSDASYAKTKLIHAGKTWLGAYMKQTKRGDSYVMGAVPDELAMSASLKKKAGDFGFGYFDASEIPFDARNQAMIDYLR